MPGGMKHSMGDSRERERGTRGLEAEGLPDRPSLASPHSSLRFIV